MPLRLSGSRLLLHDQSPSSGPPGPRHDRPLSRGMQNLSFRYTRWISRREKRTGHLFQGRYKALLIDGDSYLLELVRYIHLNPLRAGMAQSPEEHPWTSHHAYLGQYDLPWLTTGIVLAQFGATAGKARDGYVRFILDGIGEEHRKDFHCGTGDPRILGSDAFAEAALSDGAGRVRRVTMEQVLEVVLGGYRIDLDALRSASQQRRLAEARAMLAWLERECSAGNLEQVGRIVNRDAGSLSSAVRRLVERTGEDAAVAGRLAGAKSALSKLVDLEA